MRKRKKYEPRREEFPPGGVLLAFYLKNKQLQAVQGYFDPVGADALTR